VITCTRNSYGYVFCHECHAVETREKESAPLPICPRCKAGFMEVMLCEAKPSCVAEATIMTYESDVNAATYACEEHA
jgi:zinc ribbon protein